MKHLAKYLAAPAAFAFAFLLGGTPSAPISALLPTVGQCAFADDENPPEPVMDCWDTSDPMYNSELCKEVREGDCWETAATIGTAGMVLGYAGGLMMMTGVLGGLGAGLAGVALVLDAVAVGVGAACSTQFD
ncbi:MAG: hypothetical protein F4029_08865 [Gammaproteobacteria bacterium]|nr:hypothetical protein [Gammaproteobacteria bacterium]MYF30014.1 hypothetical protein [Gammaproteobacteria bacterium]MYK46326.1 hypothetical protein [Gammaproteobacteria bacterium]